MVLFQQLFHNLLCFREKMKKCNISISYRTLCFSFCLLLSLRWVRLAVKRCAHPNQTCGLTTSASWDLSHGTLNCQTLTAMGNRLTPALLSVNPRQRTRNRLLQNQSSPPLPKESTCTPEPCSLSPFSSLMWFTGPYTCDYLELLSQWDSFMSSLLTGLYKKKTCVSNWEVRNGNLAPTELVLWRK